MEKVTMASIMTSFKNTAIYIYIWLTAYVIYSFEIIIGIHLVFPPEWTIFAFNVNVYMGIKYKVEK
jgi:hypothetical protein